MEFRFRALLGDMSSLGSSLGLVSLLLLQILQEFGVTSGEKQDKQRNRSSPIFLSADFTGRALTEYLVQSSSGTLLSGQSGGNVFRGKSDLFDESGSGSSMRIVAKLGRGS